MRTPLVAGNWKMHGTLQSVVELTNALKVQWQGNKNVEVAVCPPTIFMSVIAHELKDSDIKLGAQNVSEYSQGAYTGEISAEMLTDFGCSFAIIGHSERRTIFGETDEQVADKFSAAQCNGLLPILCVGETLEQREAGIQQQVIARQLQVVMDKVGVEAVASAVIAYEPVWAIGTGKTATPEQAQEIHAAIRSQLGAVGVATRVLYGGSVKSANAAEIFSQPDIDGALVGGAALNAEEFVKICQLTEVN
jgi:triosephosphate isomerase